MRAERILCLTLVAAGHVGVLLLAGSYGLPRRVPVSPEPTTEIFFLLPQQRPDGSSASFVAPTKRPANAISKRATTVTETGQAITVPPPDEPEEHFVDWDAAARDALDSISRDQRGAAARRTFSHAFPAQSDPQARDVFGSEKENRRAGRVEGGERYWVTDNCYFDIPRDAPPDHAVNKMLLTRTCTSAPTGGGEKMFDGLAPGYLRFPKSR